MPALEVAMNADEAQRITTRIRLLVTSIAENTEKVVGLIEQARAGEAWRALGHQSWTAFVTAEFAGALGRLEKAERVPLVNVLAETGMSTRAIGSVVGVNNATVHRDLGRVADATPAEVIGIDGKTYPRKATLNKAGQVDARSTVELLSLVPPVQPRGRRRHIKEDAWQRSTDMLVGSAAGLEATLRDRSPYTAQLVAHRDEVREQVADAKATLDRVLRLLDQVDDLYG